jgi:membrane dipeptidase
MFRPKGIAMRQKVRVFQSLVLALFAAAAWQTACRPEVTDQGVQTRAQALHDRILSVDTHCDTPSRLMNPNWDVGVRHEPGRRSSGMIDLPRMAEGRLDAEFFAVFVGQGPLTGEGYARAKERALKELEAIHLMCERYPSLVGPATAPDDAYRLKREGKRAAFIGMENGYPVGRTMANLEEFYKLGVRYLTLCHSRDNDICDSSTDRQNPEDNGLSDFGKDVVAACNRLGIMVDVSHASDKSFYDILKATRAPIIASHSSCRALCDSPRNLSDDMIRALRANGGVIQICFLSSYLRTPKPNPGRDKALAELREKYGSFREIRDEAVRDKLRQEYETLNEKYPEEKATVKDVVDHIDHVVRVAGADYVGIGTDFDGGGGVEGCDSVSQMFHVTEELLRRGYSEKDIEKIWGGNIMRVFRKVVEVSKRA